MNIALRADSGQWQFTSAKILLSTDHAWNKEGVAGSQKWLPYHLPEGYSGVTGVRRQRQNESNQTLGNSPRRWRRARASISHIPLNSRCNSLYLSLNTFSSRPFLCFKLNPYHTHFYFFLFLLYNARLFKYLLFYLRILLLYIEIWHILFVQSNGYHLFTAVWQLLVLRFRSEYVFWIVDNDAGFLRPAAAALIVHVISWRLGRRWQALELGWLDENGCQASEDPFVDLGRDFTYFSDSVRVGRWFVCLLVDNRGGRGWWGIWKILLEQRGRATVNVRSRRRWWAGYWHGFDVFRVNGGATSFFIIEPIARCQRYIVPKFHYGFKHDKYSGILMQNVIKSCYDLQLFSNFNCQIFGKKKKKRFMT